MCVWMKAHLPLMAHDRASFQFNCCLKVFGLIKGQFLRFCGAQGHPYVCLGKVDALVVELALACCLVCILCSAVGAGGGR